jgi:hypothetical protein
MRKDSVFFFFFDSFFIFFIWGVFLCVGYIGSGYNI